MGSSSTAASQTRASEDEFGLWYHEQSPSGAGRLDCWFGAVFTGWRSTDDVMVALEFVLRNHPELSARYWLDDDGTLVKELPSAGGPLAVRQASPDLDEVEVARRISFSPLSLEDGDLLRVAIVAGDRGIARGLVGVVHHIVWNVRSEQRLWAELDRALDATTPAVGTEIGPAWLSPLDPIPPRSAPPDRQVHALARGALAWSAVVQQAQRSRTTTFAWLVGQLTSAVAAWSTTGRVIPMVDLDDGADDRTGQFGVHQSQRLLNVVERTTSPVDIGRRVQLQLLQLLASEIRPASQPEPRVDDAQVCKVYVRDLRSRDDLRHLQPLQLAAPRARNELSVGVAAMSDGVEVLLTARADAFTHDDIVELANRVGRALLKAVQGRDRVEEEVAHAAL